MRLPIADVGSLANVIQAAIGPVVLISGVGLLLLTLTNRLGRIVDRTRSLVRELASCGDAERPRIAGQLRILSRRARLTRLAVTLGATSVLLAGVLITLLYAAPFTAASLVRAVSFTFTLCMLALIGSMIAFIREVHLSLDALELELGDV